MRARNLLLLLFVLDVNGCGARTGGLETSDWDIADESGGAGVGGAAQTGTPYPLTGGTYWQPTGGSTWRASGGTYWRPTGGSTWRASGGTYWRPTGGSTWRASGGTYWRPTGGSTWRASGGTYWPASGGTSWRPTGGSTWRASGGTYWPASGGTSWRPTGGTTWRASGGSSWQPIGGTTWRASGGSTWRQSGGASTCAQGSWGCACYANGLCSYPFVCSSGTCTYMTSTGGGSYGGSSPVSYGGSYGGGNTGGRSPATGGMPPIAACTESVQTCFDDRACNAMFSCLLTYSSTCYTDLSCYLVQCGSYITGDSAVLALRVYQDCASVLGF